MTSDPRLPPIASARTWLFVPADRPDRFVRAHRSGADVVVVDLEDAVDAGSRAEARAGLAAAIAALNEPTPTLVRVNPVRSPHHEVDLEVIAALVPHLHGVVLTKVEDAAAIEGVADALGGLPVVGLVETAAGVERLAAVSRAEGLARLAFGAVDFGVELGLAPDSVGGTMDHVRSRMVVASRAAGLPPPVDSPCLALRDARAVRSHARRGRGLGMGGVLCVHPDQVGPATAAFVPSAQEVAEARDVVAAAEALGGGAVQVDGRMVEGPIVARARQTLRAAACTPPSPEEPPEQSLRRATQEKNT